MIHCQSCYYEALGPSDLAGHLKSVHGFGAQDAQVEAGRIAGFGYVRPSDPTADLIARLSRERDEARAESTALRAEIMHRAEIDGEDTHRLQQYTETIFRERDEALIRATRAEALALTLQAQRDLAEAALKAIDRHVVGACESAFGSPDPCEECGEMREIASQALAALKAGGA